MVMKPLSILLSMVYTPIVLAFLGETKYGVWAIVLNIVSWINYFDIGIGNGLRNRLTESITRGNEKDSHKYVSTAYVGTALISVSFFVLITVIWNLFGLSAFFKLNVSGENTNIVILFSVLFVCVNFVLSLSKTSAYAIQQPGIISVFNVIGQLLQIAAVLIIGAMFHESMLAIAVAYGFVSLLDSILVYYLITRKRKYLRPKLSCFDKRYLKPLLTLGAGFFALQISTLVLNTTDNLLISNLYGSADVTPYSLVYKVFYMAVQIHGIIILPMWSAYTEAAARHDIEWIRKAMRKINLITLAISGGVVIGIFLFEPLAAIWLQKKLVYGTPLIVIVAIYMIVQMVANNYSSFLCGVGHIKVSTVIAIIGAVMNIPLSILFARNLEMHLSGVILGSLCVMMMSFVALPIVSYRWLRNKESEWGKTE